MQDCYNCQKSTPLEELKMDDCGDENLFCPSCREFTLKCIDCKNSYICCEYDSKTDTHKLNKSEFESVISYFSGDRTHVRSSEIDGSFENNLYHCTLCNSIVCEQCSSNFSMSVLFHYCGDCFKQYYSDIVKSDTDYKWCGVGTEEDAIKDKFICHTFSLTKEIADLKEKIDTYEKYLIIFNCKESLRFKDNGFDSDEYNDSCYCKENLNYIISQLESGEDTAEKWREVIMRNKAKGVPECGHIWFTEGL